MPGKQNNQINKYIINNMDNVTAIINTAIKLAYYERNVPNKPAILQGAQVGKAFITVAHQCNNSITRDGKQVQLRSNPTIPTYQKNNETTQLTYDPGADGHYLSKKDRKS